MENSAWECPQAPQHSETPGVKVWEGACSSGWVPPAQLGFCLSVGKPQNPCAEGFAILGPQAPCSLSRRRWNTFSQLRGWKRWERVAYLCQVRTLGPRVSQL